MRWVTKTLEKPSGVKKVGGWEARGGGGTKSNSGCPPGWRAPQVTAPQGTPSRLQNTHIFVLKKREKHIVLSVPHKQGGPFGGGHVLLCFPAPSPAPVQTWTWGIRSGNLTRAPALLVALSPSCFEPNNVGVNRTQRRCLLCFVCVCLIKNIDTIKQLPTSSHHHFINKRRCWQQKSSNPIMSEQRNPPN